MSASLGSSYVRLFDVSTKKTDLDQAHSLFSKAARSPVGYPKQRFVAALKWARCAKRMNISTLSAFGCAIEQLPRIAWLGIPVNEQHSLLEEIGGGIRHAVAAAIEVGEYVMAVEWVEQGRSIVWQNLLNLRTPTDALHAVHPELANRIREISWQLDLPITHHPIMQQRQDQTQEIVKSHTRLAFERDRVIDQIRKIPNFESFLKPKAFNNLTSAAHDGPVIILNVEEYRCDALALVSNKNGDVFIVHFPLFNFSYMKGKRLLKRLKSILESAGVRDRDSRKPTRTSRKNDSETNFKALLLELWIDVVKPVIDGLQYKPQTTKLPRMWWCATGLLTLLPIHAAGDYDATEAGHKLSDYVVSSYTPTLTAVLDSSCPNPSEDFKILTIAQPSAPGYSTILKTLDEVEQIGKAAGGISVKSLTKEDATVERVRQGMKESDWIHLACHGKQDAAKPLDSGLILHDGTLKLSTIVQENLPKAEFAFLSACQTAMGDEKVAEESVHLAAGMLLAGYKGVIATMWSIKDDVAPQVAEAVYSQMLRDGKPNRKEGAYALHEAVKQLRGSGVDFTAWVPFIHIGR